MFAGIDDDKAYQSVLGDMFSIADETEVSSHNAFHVWWWCKGVATRPVVRASVSYMSSSDMTLDAGICVLRQLLCLQ